jgi:hypothetical protein
MPAIRVVCADREGEAARRVDAELRRAGRPATFVDPELTSADGLIILCDDTALPAALGRLIQMLPGRATFPNVVLVVGDAEAAGGLLAEGFRDVVEPPDVAAAVEAVLRGGPPVFMSRLREEVSGSFLPKFVEEMRQRAREKQSIARDCIDLVRAATFLEKRLHRIRKIYQTQAIDELLVQEGRIEAYLAALDEKSPRRLGRVPAFPSMPAGGGVLGKREPRYRRAHEEISDAIDWLRQAGLLPALGPAGLDAMVQTAESLRGKPLQGLRECLNIVEREIAQRLALVDRIQTQVDPVAMLQERCLERHGFAILPPGIALPESVHLIVRSLIQPPAEIYVTWCLDLRDMKLKPCADILPEVTRDLASAHERSGSNGTNGVHGELR